MSDTFNWQLPPAPGYPGSQPRPSPPIPQQMWQERNPQQQPQRLPQQSPDPDSEPFISSPSDRRPQDWASDDWALQGARNYPGLGRGPYMPQARDFAALIHGAVTGLGRWGSRYTGMPAIAMGTYASAYWKAYQKGMHERAAESYQQYRMARQMTIDRGKEEMLEFAKVYAKYHDGDKITDVHGFEQALLDVAHRYNNQSIINEIHGGNIGAVERILGVTDSHIANLIKAQHQEERQKKIDEERDLRMQNEREIIKDREDRRKRNEDERKRMEDTRKQWDPNAVGPGPGYKEEPEPPSSMMPPLIPDDTDDSDIPPEGRADASASGDEDKDTTDEDTADAAGATPQEPDTPQKPIQVADASGQVPFGGGQPVPPTQPVQRQPEQESTPIENAAQNWTLDHKLPGGLTKFPDIAARIQARGGQIESELNRLANDPNTTPEQMRAAVHKMMPNFGNALDKYLAGDLPGPRAGLVNSPYWNKVFNLGAKIDPNFNADTFNERVKSRQFWANGPGGQTMRSVGLALKHLKTLYDDLPNKPYFGTAWLDRATGIEGGVTTRFDAEIGAVNTEMVRALQGKGATIPEMKDQTDQLNLGLPEKSMRQNIEGKYKLLKSRIDQLSDDFSASTGWNRSELVKRYGDFSKSPFATADDKDAADRINGLMGGEARVPATAPSGSKVMYDKNGKQWLVYPDNSVHGMPQ